MARTSRSSKIAMLPRPSAVSTTMNRIGFSIGEAVEAGEETGRRTVRGPVPLPPFGQFQGHTKVQASLTFSFQTIYLDSLSTNFYTSYCTSRGHPKPWTTKSVIRLFIRTTALESLSKLITEC